MIKGVREQTLSKLVEKFEDKIGDREFIIIVDLSTEQEFYFFTFRA